MNPHRRVRSIRQRIRENPVQSLHSPGRPATGSSDARPLPIGSSITSLLAKWEADLVERVRAVQLIGELHLPYSEFERLSSNIRMFVQQQRKDPGHELSERFPACTAVFLVFAGVYEYRTGNYWQFVRSRIGVSNSPLGEAFEGFISRMNLATFPALSQERTLRFVTPILLHGGIPDGCMDDYFNLLLYSMNRPEWTSLPADELIQEWNARRFGFLQVDMPVQRFMIHGGRVAQDFLQRSIDLLNDARRFGAVPNEGGVGLPARVVDRFTLWFAGLRDETPSPGVAQRLPSPRLYFDPWGGDAVGIELPIIRPREPGMGIHWRIDDGRQQIEIKPPSTHDQFALTSATEVILSRPATRWDISCCAADRDLGTWQYSGFTPQRPLMLFDPSTTGLVRWSDALPSGDYWLIHPSDHHLSVTLPSEVVQDLETHEWFPQLRGPWSNYQARWVTLPAGGTLHVAPQPGQRSANVSIRSQGIDRAGRADVLLDDVIVPGVMHGAQRIPVAAQSPVIRIPALRGEPHDLRRWTIVITPSSGSMPSQRIVKSASELESTLTPSGAMHLDLGQADLLGNSPVGTFSVGVRGPLGSDARAEVAIVPGLRISGHTGMAVANRQINEPATIILSTSTAVRFSALSDISSIERSVDHREARVIVSEREVAIGIAPIENPSQRLSMDPPVLLRVPIAGVRWALVNMSEHERGQITWASHQLELSQDVFRASSDPALLVEGFDNGTISGLMSSGGSARLTLRRADRTHVQQLEPVPIRRDRIWLSLRPFVDTIASMTDAVVHITLDLFTADGAITLHERPVLRVSRELVVENLRIADTVSTEVRTVTVHWTQPYAVRDRYILIWPLARPWDRPQRVPIPDDVTASFTFSLPVSTLPPGPYRFQLVVIDPWMATDHQLPTMSTNAVEVSIGSVDELYSYSHRPSLASTDLLERFLLSHQPETLHGLDELLSREDPQPALMVLDALLRTDDADLIEDESWLKIATLYLRDALVEHRDLFRALKRLEHGARDTLRLLAALGVPQAKPTTINAGLERLSTFDRTSLERHFPILFLSRVAIRRCASSEDHETAALILGEEPLQLLLSAANSTDDTLCTVQYFHRLPDRHAINFPSQRLELMRGKLGFVPTGLLDRESFDLAMFDWLIALNEPRASARRVHISQWIDDARPRIETDLWEPFEGHWSSHLDIALSLCRNRVDRHTFGLAALPYVCGGVALLQRIRARRPDLSRSLRLSADLLRHYGRVIAVICPQLYLHDLCLFDVLVAPDASGDPRATDTRALYLSEPWDGGGSEWLD